MLEYAISTFILKKLALLVDSYKCYTLLTPKED